MKLPWAAGSALFLTILVTLLLESGTTSCRGRLLYALLGPRKPSSPSSWPPQKQSQGPARPLVAMIQSVAQELKELKEDIKEDIHQIVRKERLWIERLEQKISQIYDKSYVLKTHAISRCVLGSLVLFSGAQFSRVVVMVHTFRVTGWPRLNSCFMELGKYYNHAREIVRKEVGQIRSPAEILQAVQYQLQAARLLVKESKQAKEDGKITEEEAREIVRKAHIDIHRLNQEAWILNQALSSVAAISAAVNLPKLRDLAISTYTGLLACVASANNLTLRKISVGFDLGNILADDLHCLAWSIVEASGSDVLARALPEETRKFISLTVGLIGTAKGMVLMHSVIPKLSLQISAAALGARWITDAVTDVTDPYLQKFGKREFKDRAPFALLHLALVVGGVYFQSRGSTLPGGLENLLKPLIYLETKLKQLELTKLPLAPKK